MITTSDGEQYEDSVAHTLGVKMPQVASNEPKKDPNQPVLGGGELQIRSQTLDPDKWEEFKKKLDEAQKKWEEKNKASPQVPVKPQSELEPQQKTITIVRHGATHLNNDTNNSVDKIRGWSDVPLTDEGRDQAHTAGKQVEGQTVDSIHTSDLSRAHETAKIIGSYVGIEPTPTDKLRPWDLGDFTGKSTKESLPHIQEYAQNKPDEPIPGGESFNQFKERAFEGLHEAMNASDNPLIVTHHRTERLLKAWDKAGQPEDHSIDLKTFLQKGEDTGKVEQMDIKSMTHVTPQGKIQTPLLQQLSKKLLETNQTIGDLMTGRIDPASEEGIKKITDIAAKTMGYGMLGAEKYAAGVFGGQLPALAKATAEAMEARGKSALAIKATTGLERGADTMWRKEISDYPSKVNLQREPIDLPPLQTAAPEGWGAVKGIGLGPLREGAFRLGDVYEHPQLYKDYPELKDMTLQVSEEAAQGAHGMFSYVRGDPTQSQLILNPKTSMDPRMVIAHELQHYIQYKEGFSIGPPGYLVPEDVLEGFKGRLLRKYKTKEIEDVWDPDIDIDESRHRAAQILSHADYLVYRALAHESEAHAVGDRVNIPIKDIRKSLGSENEPIDRRDQLLLSEELRKYGLGIPQK